VFNSPMAVSIAARSCASCAFFSLASASSIGCFLVGRELVAEFLQLFFGLEDQAVRLVQLVGTVARGLVGIGVGLGLFLHLLDLLLAQAAAGLDADALLLARGLVLGAHVQDAVGVDVEGHFDLRQAARGGWDAVQVEAADGAVAAGHGALALQHVDLHAGLVVAGRAEGLALLGGDGGVGLDQLGHHTAHGLDAEAQRGNVQQQHVLHFTGEHAALDGGAHGHHFVRVHALAGLFAEEFLHRLLDRRDAGAAAHQDHLIDLAGLQARVLQCAFARGDGALDQAGSTSCSNLARLRVRTKCFGMPSTGMM
jgi:hypothetical protein